METGGHSKYTKGLIHNILNANPDYALLVINAVSGITEKTIEQYKLAIALQTPCFIVVTHID
jgi:GTPase